MNLRSVSQVNTCVDGKRTVRTNIDAIVDLSVNLLAPRVRRPFHRGNSPVQPGHRFSRFFHKRKCALNREESQ